MSRIDGYGSGNTINPAETGQILSSDEIKAKSAGQATTDADAAAYLKIGAKPPLPAFAGTVSQGDTADGKQALQVIGHNIGIDYSAILALIVKLSSDECYSHFNYLFYIIFCEIRPVIFIQSVPQK